MYTKYIHKFYISVDNISVDNKDHLNVKNNKKLAQLIINYQSVLAD